MKVRYFDTNAMLLHVTIAITGHSTGNAKQETFARLLSSEQSTAILAKASLAPILLQLREPCQFHFQILKQHAG